MSETRLANIEDDVKKTRAVFVPKAAAKQHQWLCMEVWDLYSAQLASSVMQQRKLSFRIQVHLSSSL